MKNHSRYFIVTFKCVWNDDDAVLGLPDTLAWDIYRLFPFFFINAVWTSLFSLHLWWWLPLRYFYSGVVVVFYLSRFQSSGSQLSYWEWHPSRKNVLDAGGCTILQPYVSSASLTSHVPSHLWTVPRSSTESQKVPTNSTWYDSEFTCALLVNTQVCSWASSLRIRASSFVSAWFLEHCMQVEFCCPTAHDVCRMRLLTW